MQAIASSSCSGPAGPGQGGIGIGGRVTCSGSIASARKRTRSRAGCQARTSTGQPPTWRRRTATPSRTRSVRSELPRGIRQGEGGRTSASATEEVDIDQKRAAGDDVLAVAAATAGTTGSARPGGSNADGANGGDGGGAGED